MANFTAADIKALREETGAGMMDCKKALDESDGDMDKAREWVRQRGLAKAEKKADRETKEGYIAAYVHSTNKIAALVEILCETDFVARNPEFQEMARGVAMQVASMNPENLEELLAQDFIKDPSMTIEELVKGLSGKIGEKFVVNRFMRYEVGQAVEAE
jgi:elongation factor Ts